MLLPDTNVLVYALNEAADQFDEADAWLRHALAGSETVGFSWNVLLGALRILTNPRALESPLPVSNAAAEIRTWLGSPPSVIVEPADDHLTRVAKLLDDSGTAGNLVSDAHLGALALERDATVVTFDRDFERFQGVRWRTPGQ